MEFDQASFELAHIVWLSQYTGKILQQLLSKILKGDSDKRLS